MSVHAGGAGRDNVGAMHVEEIVVPISSCHERLKELLDDIRATMRRGDDAACPDVANVVEGILEVLIVGGAWSPVAPHAREGGS